MTTNEIDKNKKIPLSIAKTPCPSWGELKESTIERNAGVHLP